MTLGTQLGLSDTAAAIDPVPSIGPAEVAAATGTGDPGGKRCTRSTRTTCKATAQCVLREQDVSNRLRHYSG